MAMYLLCAYLEYGVLCLESVESSEEWQEEVELLPMVHNPKLEEFLPPTRQHQRRVTIEELMESIQVCLSQLYSIHKLCII